MPALGEILGREMGVKEKILSDKLLRMYQLTNQGQVAWE
jgi:hypothetical protein